MHPDLLAADSGPMVEAEVIFLRTILFLLTRMASDIDSIPEARPD